MGRADPGPAQRSPDPDDGQLRNAGPRAGRLCNDRDSQTLAEALLRGRYTSERGAPTDTLAAAQAVARSWYQPERLFALLDAFYTVPEGKTMRAVPFMPYLNSPPSAWVLPLKFDGGGYRAGGKAMFDSEGNLWVGDNFTIGWQGQDRLWQGNATKFDPNGQPISPITTGFSGGGMQGAPLVRRSTRTTTPGCRITAASPLLCSTKPASR